jgi:protein TonB
MFDQTFVNANAQTRKPWTVAASLIAQTVLVAALLIAPLLHIAAIRPVLQGPLTVRLMKTEAPLAKPVAAKGTFARVRRYAVLDALAAPRSVPAHIDMTPDPPQATTEISGTPFAGSGVLSNALGPIGIAPPEPPKPAPAPRTTKPLAVSSGVQSAKLIYGPRPAYPPIARTARVEGTVRLLAMISREGAIENLQLIAGPPLLVAAAMQAIGQWKYQPTVLNSQPVAVTTEIDVTFTLR